MSHIRKSKHVLYAHAFSRVPRLFILLFLSHLGTPPHTYSKESKGRQNIPISILNPSVLVELQSILLSSSGNARFCFSCRFVQFPANGKSKKLKMIRLEPLMGERSLTSCLFHYAICFFLIRYNKSFGIF